MTDRSLSVHSVSVRSLSLGAVGLAVVAALIATYPRPVIAVLGLALILVAPGLALGFALRLLPARTFGLSAVLVLGGSLAIAVVVGVVLAALPVGLTTTSAPLTLGGVTMVLAAVALVRQPAGGVTLPGLRPRPGLNAALLVAALLIAIAAVVTAHVASDRYDADHRVTQLSLAPRAGGRTVQVSVENHQSAATEFRVQLSAGASTSARTVQVAKGASSRFVMALPAGASATAVRASLFEPGRSTALRTVGVAG